MKTLIIRMLCYALMFVGTHHSQAQNLTMTDNNLNDELKPLIIKSHAPPYKPLDLRTEDKSREYYLKDSSYFFVWSEDKGDWNNDEKILYQYNEGSLMTEQIKYAWSGDQWTFYRKENNAYNPSSLKTESIKYMWHSDSQNWVPTLRYTWMYDEDGNTMEWTTFKWDEGINDWKSWRKYVMQYEGSLETLKYFYNWDDDLNDWVYAAKSIKNYDSEGNLIIQTEYGWEEDLGIWSPNTMYEYAYNQDNLLISHTRYIYNEQLENWKGDWRYLYSYSDAGHTAIVENQDWNDNLNDWLADWKAIYEYDTYGNQASDVWYDWNSDDNIWELTWRNEYFYNDQNNMTEHFSFDWNEGNEEWVFTSHTEFEFDNHENQITIIKYLWNQETESWTEYEKQSNYWSLAGTGINNYFDNSFFIYPNPTKTNFISLNHYMKYRIYDFSGKLLFITETTNKIDISSLSNGVYLIVNEKDQSVKLIIQ